MTTSVLDNLPQSAQIELWKIATESKDPLHKVEVTWYLDEADKVLHAVEFMGWPTTGGGAGALSTPTTISGAC